MKMMILIKRFWMHFVEILQIFMCKYIVNGMGLIASQEYLKLLKVES